MFTYMNWLATLGRGSDLLAESLGVLGGRSNGLNEPSNEEVYPSTDLWLARIPVEGLGLTFQCDRESALTNFKTYSARQKFLSDVRKVLSESKPEILMLSFRSKDGLLDPTDPLVTTLRQSGYALAIVGAPEPSDVPVSLGGRPLRQHIRFLTGVRTGEPQDVRNRLDFVPGIFWASEDQTTFSRCPRPDPELPVEISDELVQRHRLWSKLLEILRLDEIRLARKNVHQAVEDERVRIRLHPVELAIAEGFPNLYFDSTTLNFDGKLKLIERVHVDGKPGRRLRAVPTVGLQDVLYHPEILGERSWSHADTQWLLGYQLPEDISLTQLSVLPTKPQVELGLISVILYFFERLRIDSPFRDLVLTETSPALSAEFMFRRAQHRQLSQPVRETSEGKATSVLLYALNRKLDELIIIRAPSSSSAWELLESKDFDETFEVFGSTQDLVERCPILSRPPNMLSVGRPRIFMTKSELARCPDRPGIYRIFRKADPEHPSGLVYVGQATRLRTRLKSHEKIKEWPWDSPAGIDRIEVISGKALAFGACWDQQNLDDAEAQLIERARARERQGGPTLVNQTVGRNGRKALVHAAEFVWQPGFRASTDAGAKRR